MTAASQSMLASRVAPSLMLVPVVMNLLVKSPRRSQLPQSMSRPVPASSQSGASVCDLAKACSATFNALAQADASLFTA